MFEYDFCYITPEDLVTRYPEILKTTSLKKLEKLANQKDRICLNCLQANVWKFGECNMCFSCVTGETDASQDFELIPSKGKSGN